jgi:hypothetical protein
VDVILTLEVGAEGMTSSLPRLLVVVLELVLALPGDEPDLGRSSSDEISTLATVAGFTASLCDGKRRTMGPRVDSWMIDRVQGPAALQEWAGGASPFP